MNVQNNDGTVTRLEGQEALDAFAASKGPCVLTVGRSLRVRGRQRHRGEGLLAMMHRLQGTRP